MLKNNGFHNRHSPVLRFSPLSLFSGGAPGAWYDPSDFTTLFQDSAGTTPVTAVEQPVGLMLDRSGNGNHAFQTTDPSRPILKIDGNGKYYLLFDGINDSFSTNSISFTSTDKMSVFAGVRKLSDAATGIVAELSSGAIAGSIAVYTAGSGIAGYGGYSMGSFGPVFTDPATTYAAPITNTLTELGDISGDRITLRVNGAQIVQATGNQGTGNYGNYPLYIGRRNNASLPFNGQIYSLIVVGKAVTATELSLTEAWVNGKTGAYA